MKRKNCYIYTRVSTSMQVDGFSLDAQKEKLRRYAEFQDFMIAGEYSDEGKSGKNIEGRPEFQTMLNDISEGKDNVQYVLVFKLSRFGRNAADVLNSLQLMQDYGVNLICVEDGIDSSKDSGKLKRFIGKIKKCSFVGFSEDSHSVGGLNIIWLNAHVIAPSLGCHQSGKAYVTLLCEIYAKLS